MSLARLSTVGPRALAVGPRTFASTPSALQADPTALSSFSSKKIKVGDEEIPESFLAAPLVPRTHGIPTAVLHLRSHHVDRLRIYLHFALHAANALNIPCTSPSHLPTKRTLITVPKSPFVHKSAQENFSESVHKRALKIYDTDPLVLSQWLKYLQENALPGVALKVVKWERAGLGFGKEMVKEALGKKRSSAVGMTERIKELADEIVEKEMKKAAGAQGAEASASPDKTAAPKTKSADGKTAAPKTKFADKPQAKTSSSPPSKKPAKKTGSS
ncbi:mitochondrial 37S ribosomal protein rsm10 [Tulasnella sp. 425]|nr:mitochondrial 37S ribosomal protein rsm10 [Tulasnella sp. 425]